MAQQASCPAPVLSRLIRHRVAPGQTLATIAQKYNLLPATLMGFNPTLRSGQVPVGGELVIPPYNGVRVELRPGQTLREMAKLYKVRPDVLFEVNGCQPAPRIVFIPGVNWSPVGAPTQTLPNQVGQILAGSPFPAQLAEAPVLLGYGYGMAPGSDKVAFHSGIDLAAPVGTSVLAVGNGTVAFAGTQGTYGNLVVINHAEGLQTRYAQLASIRVLTGQTIRQGQALGTVGTSGRPSSKEAHLHFELRSRSKVGWVAENPAKVLLQGK
jgi:lysostaphin